MEELEAREHVELRDREALSVEGVELPSHADARAVGHVE
jgi:hypothetical protein